MRPHDSVQQLLNVNNDDVGGCWRALYDTKAFDECRLVTLPQTSLLVNDRCRSCRELVIEKRPKFKLSSLANHHQTNKYVLEVDCWLVTVTFGLHGVTHRLDGAADGGPGDLHCSILPSAPQSTGNPPRSRIQGRFGQ